MPRCTLCKTQGHNIRTCQDPRIKDEINGYITDWVATELMWENIVFTDDMRRGLKADIQRNTPVFLIYAISVQYCHRRRTDSLDIHIDSIVDRIIAEATHVNQLSREQKEEWCLTVTGMNIDDWLEFVCEMDSEIFAEIVEIAVSELQNYPEYQIILKEIDGGEISNMECVICQEEKPIHHFNKTQCGHSFCNICISSYLNSKKTHRANCPLCRSDIMSLETSDLCCYESLDRNISKRLIITF